MTIPNPGTISLPFGITACNVFGSFDGVVEACDVVACVELVVVVVVVSVIVTGVGAITDSCWVGWALFCFNADTGEFGFIGLIGETGESGLFTFVFDITQVFEVVIQSDHTGVPYGSEQVDDLLCIILPTYPA